MAGRAISPADPCLLQGFGCTANKEPIIESDINVWRWFMCSQKWNCTASLFPKQNYNHLYRFLHIYALAIFMHSYLWAIYIIPGSDPGNIQYESPIHECRNCERGRAVSFMRIHKLDFRYRVLFYVVPLPFSLVVTIHCTLQYCSWGWNTAARAQNWTQESLWGEEGGRGMVRAESIEWFTEDQPILRSVVRFASPPTPFPLSRQQVVSLYQSFCLSPVELTDERRGERGGRRVKSYDARESLGLYKSFNTLWVRGGGRWLPEWGNVWRSVALTWNWELRKKTLELVTSRCVER